MSWKASAKSVSVFTSSGAKLIQKEPVVQYFLSKQKGLVPGDYTNTRLPFFRRNYPSMFNFTQVGRNTTMWTAVEQEPEESKTERPERPQEEAPEEAPQPLSPILNTKPA